MSTVTSVLLVIVCLFAILLVLKNSLLARMRYCTICLAVSLTWIALLLASWFGRFDDSILIGILMGQSILGGYYLLEKHVPKRYLVFRIPVLLTFTLIAYSAVSQAIDGGAWLLVASIWTITGTLYAYRSLPIVRRKVDALIECCGNW